MLAKLTLCLGVLGALAAAPAAAGDGPLFVSQGGLVIVIGSTRLIPIADLPVNHTQLVAVSTKDGSELNQLDLVGMWGLPSTPAGADGLSPDGKRLVLADTTAGLVSPSLFLVVDPKTMRIVQPITLNGYYSYDALSPDGRRLYLIRYTQGRSGDLSHYVVRAYDLKRQRLLPGRIADRTQKSWVMRGSPVARTTSADGRWVYTLYTNPNDAELTLHGSTLSVKPWFGVDTKTWRVSRVPRASFPWWSLSFLTLVPLALVAGRRRAKELSERVGDLLRVSKREVVV